MRNTPLLTPLRHISHFVNKPYLLLTSLVVVVGIYSLLMLGLIHQWRQVQEPLNRFYAPQLILPNGTNTVEQLKTNGIPYQTYNNYVLTSTQHQAKLQSLNLSFVPLTSLLNYYLICLITLTAMYVTLIISLWFFYVQWLSNAFKASYDEAYYFVINSGLNPPSFKQSLAYGTRSLMLGVNIGVALYAGFYVPIVLALSFITLLQFRFIAKH